VKVEAFVKALGADFFAGVPDSQLKALCNYLMQKYGIAPKHHIIGANEGNCAAIAAGYHLATGKVPVVYMQNSGEGNIINPVASLLSDDVYGIPILFVIGWRGEPGVHDEPQHIFQGKVTLRLLADMDIQAFVLDKGTTVQELEEAMQGFKAVFRKGKSAAIVVKKDALSYDGKIAYKNAHTMLREEIIQHIVDVSGEDPIISTTGKASRELFEIREKSRQGHQYDFLTVGSMGHASSIALGVALQKPEKKIWCIDGDGAAIMHMGALAVIGAGNPQNLVHIVINNEAHESVGGMPTVANKINLSEVAKACGYAYTICVDTFADLDGALKKVKKVQALSMIEVKCAIGARADLGRPTTTAMDNKNMFMRYISEEL